MFRSFNPFSMGSNGVWRRTKRRVDNISLVRYNLAAFNYEDGISLGAIFEGSII
jgi:hypothetical protein